MQASILLLAFVAVVEVEKLGPHTGTFVMNFYMRTRVGTNATVTPIISSKKNTVRWLQA